MKPVASACGGLSPQKRKPKLAHNFQAIPLYFYAHNFFIFAEQVFLPVHVVAADGGVAVGGPGTFSPCDGDERGCRIGGGSGVVGLEA